MKPAGQARGAPSPPAGHAAPPRWSGWSRLARFLGLLLMGSLIAAVPAFQPIDDALAHLCAIAANAVLGWVGEASAVDAATIDSPRFQEVVGASCTAMECGILVAAAVLALPSTWRQRAVGLALGLAGVFATNVLRIASLFWIGVHAPRLFVLAHARIWVAMLEFGVLSLILGWAAWAQSPLRIWLRRFWVRWAVAYFGATALFLGGETGMPLPLGRLATAEIQVGTAPFLGRDNRRELSVRFADGNARIEIANRERMLADGSGPIRDVDVDTFGFVWGPLVLLGSLFAAGRRRPGWRTIGAWLAVWAVSQAGLMVLLALAIRINGVAVGLATLSPPALVFWERFLELSAYPIAAGLPAGLWAWLTFQAGGDAPRPGTGSNEARGGAATLSRGKGLQDRPGSERQLTALPG